MIYKVIHDSSKMYKREIVIYELLQVLDKALLLGSLKIYSFALIVALLYLISAPNTV